MTRWTSPNERNTPTVEPWGHCVVGTVTVDLRVREDDLTVNMYGHTTPTYDLLVQIIPGTAETQQHSLSLPGRVQSAFVLRRGSDLFCIFNLLKREYVLFDSNATHDVERSFIVAIPSGACWVGERNQWKPWNSATPAECPDAVPAYLALRRLFGASGSGSSPVKRGPRLFPSVRSLRKEGAIWGTIILLFSLLALPVRLALYPIRWLRARKEYREAVARHSNKQSEWRVMTDRFSEMPLTRDSTQCFATN